MNGMNVDIKKVMENVKSAQVKLQKLVKDQSWVDDARKYAERQSKEVKKLLNTDMSKVKAFLERERKELERIQKQIPGEVKKFKSFVQDQRKELEKLIAGLRKANAAGGARTKSKSTTKKKAKSAGSKSSGTKKKSPSSSRASATAST